MSEGWVKIHRKLLQDAIFVNPKLLKVWIWCLLKASHKDHELYVGLNKVVLKPGQFIFGRNAASKELKIKPTSLRNYINVLNQDSYLDIKSNNKFSVITVKSWTKHQVLDIKEDYKVKTNRQQSDTNKNVKNVKQALNSSKELRTKEKAWDEYSTAVLEELGVSDSAWIKNTRQTYLDKAIHGTKPAVTTFIQKEYEIAKPEKFIDGNTFHYPTAQEIEERKNNS